MGKVVVRRLIMNVCHHRLFLWTLEFFQCINNECLDSLE